MKTINKQTIMKALRRLTWTSRVNGDVYARFCERPVVKPRRAYSAKFLLGMAFLLAVTATFATNAKREKPWGFIVNGFGCEPHRVEQDYCLPTGDGTRCTVNLGAGGTFPAFTNMTCAVPLYQVFP